MFEEGQGAPQVVKYEDFIQLSMEEQISLMTDWRAQLKNKDIIDQMGIYPVKYYSLLGKLGLKDRVRDETRGFSSSVRSTLAPVKFVSETPRATETVQSTRQRSTSQMAIQQFHATFTGRFRGTDIAARLKLIASALEGIDEEFVTDVRITL